MAFGKEDLKGYDIFIKRLTELGEKIDTPLRQYDIGRNDIMMKHALKDTNGAVLYSPYPQSKYPYQYTQEGATVMENEVLNYANTQRTVHIDIHIDTNELLGRNDNSKEIPKFIGPLHIEVFKNILICPCIVNTDGTIDRSKE